MSVKKAFGPMVDFLNANKGKRVSEVLDKVMEFAEAKTGGGGRTSEQVIREGNKPDGKVLFVFCYYHKRWEDVSKVEFGKKANSPTGLSNMCKEGTSAWTKQQSEAKKAKAQLLDDVASEKVKPTEIPKRMEAIEAKRIVVVPRKENPGTVENPTAKAAK